MRKKVQGALLRPQNVVKYLPQTDKVTRKFMDMSVTWIVTSMFEFNIKFTYIALIRDRILIK